MPALGKWAIRMFSPFDTDNESLTFVGSFDNADGRFHDDVVVFSGMFGLPDFMYWYVHEDMETFDFSKYSLDLRLYLVGDVDKIFHQEQYRVVSIKDDLNSNRKVIFAIQEEYALIKTLLFDAEVFSLPYDKTRSPVKLLREVLTANGILAVVYMEHFDDKKRAFLYEYPTFAFEPDWTVFDFIDYVASENALEWTIKNGILFIGPELWTYEELNATDPIDAQEVLRITKTPHVMKLYSFGMPLDVLYHYEYKQGQNMTPVRCVWVKHQVGAAGDKTVGCFVDIGTSISQDIFIDSLEGDKEIAEAYYIFSQKRLFKQIKVGAVVLDESEDGYDSKFIEQITYEKKFEHWTKKTPRDRVLNKDDPSYILHKIGRTTPYLGDGEGILFPSPETPANFIMLMPDDRIENTVQGPFVMGDGSEEFVVIKKNAKDFRLQLPGGWCLYVSEGGGTFLQTSDIGPQSLPIGTSDDKHIILKSEDSYIRIEGDGVVRIQRGGEGYITIEPTGNIKIIGTATIDVNTSGTVNIGAGATIVNLAGGSFFLPKDIHTHQVTPGPAIPGPPATAAPTSQLTTKTKAT